MDKIVNLSWKITPPDPNDLNNAEIRRSNDGTVFSDVVNMESGLGALPSNVEANFNATDTVTVAANTTKTVWYKVIVYDNDGNYTYSNEEQITLEMLPPPAPILDPPTEA